MRIGRGVVGVAVLCGALAARAEPLPRSEVPEPLIPWVDWVLRGAEESTCPLVHGDGETRQCTWPSRLSLTVDEEGGRFRQEWRVDVETWVPLPGDARVWPQRVRSGETPRVVVARGGVPAVRLRPGTHVLRGGFRWRTPPESIRIPAETGLVALTVDGRPVRFPVRDRAGRLWLRQRVEEPEAESRIDVIVHRRVIDEVPLQLDSSVEVRVSGRSREVVLGRAVPARFIPMSLDSPLPARLEPDGRLRLQVRAGTWHLRMLSRHEEGPVEVISAPAHDPEAGPWDPAEVWVFDARNDLRLVHVEGVPGIDPQQTDLPQEWRHLPAYLVEPGASMRLVEKRRGDQDPAPDQLSLTRTWWLDFDGGGYTVHDEITGTLTRSWRLDTEPPTVLGRVAIDGQDRFISRLDGEGRAGVEVRRGQLVLDADSRIDGGHRAIPAVGWGRDFQKVSAQLNLPPGWRLFHAGGVDSVHSTWITGWSLLEIFLVLVTGMIVAQIHGWAWGGVALVALALTYPEQGAPRWTWLFLLGAHALLRVVPEGRLRRGVGMLRGAAVALLAVVAIPFMVQQARVAIHPALEFPGLAVQGDRARAVGRVEAVTAEEPAEAGKVRPRRSRSLLDSIDEARPSSPPALERLEGSLSNYYAPDPQALVSTGPGLPHWGWRTVHLAWRGPVTADQEIRLFLVPPWANFLLAWLRIALVAALALCVLEVLPRITRRGAVAGALLLLVGTFSPSAATADIPTPELLEELRNRLLDPPDCVPGCAASPRLRLEVGRTRLRSRFEVDVAAATAIPLPGGIDHWMPETILLDGAPATGIAHGKDGSLRVAVAPGRHQVILEGPLPDRDSVHLPLPLRPRRVEASLSGWTLDGVHEDGRPDQSLQLTRIRDGDETARATLEPRDLPPFVRVERKLSLGLSWLVETTVRRLTPPGRSVFVEVPLLAGESVTTDDLPVEEGRAVVSMGPGVSSVQWSSVLDHAPTLELVAPETLSWSEIWWLDAAPHWNVEISGIPTVHVATPPPLRIRQWRPWPGESVTLRVVRPEGVEGRTLTLDRSVLEIRPGLRASEASLGLSLRASRGVQHPVVLPEGAVLQTVEIDGALQPVRAIEGTVVLPVRPGKHEAKLVWRSPAPIRARFVTPEVDPGGPSVNSEIEVAMPADRWILLLGGPRLGPAVLFWSLLVVAVLLALGLGRLDLTPLTAGSWFLLFVGLTQVSVWASLLVVGWLLAIGWRRVHGREATDGAFDALQVLLAGWSLAAGIALVVAIQQGLLGLPDMQIDGNGSSAHVLRWYLDRSDGALPTAWVVSVPILVYRLAMLLWALWLARALVTWVRWAWECFTADGLWRPLRRRAPEGSTRA